MKDSSFVPLILVRKWVLDFPGGPVENLPANAGGMGSIPGPERSHVPQNNKVCELQLLSPCSGAHTPQQEKPTGHN